MIPDAEGDDRQEKKRIGSRDFFDLKARGTSLSTEINGGITTCIASALATLAMGYAWQVALAANLIAGSIFLFLDIFYTIGTLIGVGEQAGFVKDGTIPRAKGAFLADPWARWPARCSARPRSRPMWRAQPG